ncbi:aspartate aminotransferase family protein [Salisediminibacterium halotolerans]|uniref:aspartate aminotransferase family protein n=2 Tax=Salisediminibacterium halotolerans TaxID=517425 RepID=UPI000EB07555|nr:acetylornithine/succinylornithine family transaminase [Salisediminibacterium halotolerans]
MSIMFDSNSVSYVMNTYSRFPLELASGEGSWVVASDGASYLDYTSGISVCNLGHRPQAVAEALESQLAKIWHTSNLFHIPKQEELAKLLAKTAGMDRVFFANSGAEANEAALKLVKKYWNDLGEYNRTSVLTFEDSFHGRTGTTMAATAQPKIHNGFEPLTPGFVYQPFNSVESFDILNNAPLQAVMLELIQGEGGVRPADSGWVKNLVTKAQSLGIPVIVDEVQTGMGRTGTPFLFEQYGIKPDIVTVAKGLGSGLPVGAMIAKDTFAASFSQGSHGSTFGGNPLVMSAALASAETLFSTDILTNVQKVSEKIFDKLNEFKLTHSVIEDVRGAGLMIGIELTQPVKPLLADLRERNVLALPAGEKVVRVLPPLNTDLEEADFFLEKFAQSLQNLHETEDVQ